MTKPSTSPSYGLVDAHIHTSGISLCSRISPRRLMELCKIEGLYGIVLTNHYKLPHVRGSFEDWRQRYVEEYEETAEWGKKEGIRVFFGVEVTLCEAPQNDFTLYGLSTRDILDADPLYHLTLSKLSSYVHEKGGLIYHAHPFRNTHPADPTLLDGVEINCHPLYKSCREEDVRAFANKHHLRLSCGSDYHGDTYKAHCGMLVPPTVTDTSGFVAYLKETRNPDLVVAPDPMPGQSIAPGSGDSLRSAGF